MISTNSLTVSKAGKTFCADLSEIPVSEFVRVCNDSSDLGVCVVSHVTGETSDWYIADSVTEPDEGLLYYLLRPTPESVLKCPALAGWSLKLFND